MSEFRLTIEQREFLEMVLSNKENIPDYPNSKVVMIKSMLWRGTYREEQRKRLAELRAEYINYFK